MKLYISGPMTGIPDFNAPAFNAAAAELRAAGYDVINPADNGSDESKTWADYMRIDLRQLLDCDGMALLPGWSASRGARLEKYVATELGMPATAASHWIQQAHRLDDLIRELVS